MPEEPDPQALAAQSKGRTLKEMVTAENFKSAVANVLPSHLKAERFIRIAVMAMTRNKKLNECTPETFFRCLIDLSAMGLEPDGRRAHLIPFKRTLKGRGGQPDQTVTDCTLIVDYKGLVELVRRSGEVSVIHADVVYEQDDFDFSYGSRGFLHHKPALDSPRQHRRAVYCYVKMKDGSEDFLVWGTARVEAIRKRSKSPDEGPWKSDYDEMSKKSVFRNQSKWLPFSPELREKIERDDESVIDTDFELLDEGTPQAAREVIEQKKTELRKVSAVATKSGAAEKIDEAAKAEPIKAESQPAEATPELKASETTETISEEQIRAYEKPLGIGKFGGIIQRHLDRLQLTAFEDIPPQERFALMADLEDALKQRPREPEQSASAKPVFGEKQKYTLK